MRRLVEKISPDRSSFSDLAVSLVGWTLRIAGAACGFLTFRQLFVAIGAEGVAAIAILQSVAGWVSILEIGTGFVAQNFLVNAKVAGTDSRAGLSRLLLRPLYLSFGAALVLAVFHGAWIQFVTAGEAAAGLRTIPGFVIACTVFFLLSVLSGPVIRILYAEGKTMLANALPVVGSVLSFAGVLTCQRLGLKAMEAYVVCMIIPPVLPLMYIAVKRLAAGAISPRGGGIEVPAWKGHLDYTIFNFASILVLRVDIYVLSRVLSAEQLVAYISVQKLFSLVFLGPQTLLSTLHPKFSALFMKGYDTKLVRMALLYALLPSAALVIAAAGIAIFDQEICMLLTSGNLSTFGVGLIGAALLYYVFRVWTDAWATVLLATDRARKLLVPTLLQGAVSAPLLYLLGAYIGEEGGYLALVVAFLLTTAWWAPRVVLSSIRRPTEAVA